MADNLGHPYQPGEAEVTDEEVVEVEEPVVAPVKKAPAKAKPKA